MRRAVLTAMLLGCLALPASAAPVVLSGSLDDAGNAALVWSDLGAALFDNAGNIANNVAIYSLSIGSASTVTFESFGWGLGGFDARGRIHAARRPERRDPLLRSARHLRRGLADSSGAVHVGYADHHGRAGALDRRRPGAGLAPAVGAWPRHRLPAFAAGLSRPIRCR